MKEDIEELFRDMAQELFVEYTEEDFIAMENDFYSKPRNRVYEAYQEFRESSRKDYDIEEREEI
ncbi:MAG: hypothetical protein IJX34_01015 [Clostridia bacterium]|nr:hypothetical protein [Clostridia bacterium]